MTVQTQNAAQLSATWLRQPLSNEMRTSHVRDWFGSRVGHSHSGHHWINESIDHQSNALSFALRTRDPKSEQRQVYEANLIRTESLLQDGVDAFETSALRAWDELIK